jgi:hypothetical protein
MICEEGTTQSLLCNINAKLWFSRTKGSRSFSVVSSMVGIDFAMSSSEKGMLESSSNRTEKLVALFDSSFIIVLMLDVN